MHGAVQSWNVKHYFDSLRCCNFRIEISSSFTYLEILLHYIHIFSSMLTLPKMVIRAEFRTGIGCQGAMSHSRILAWWITEGARRRRSAGRFARIGTVFEGVNWKRLEETFFVFWHSIWLQTNLCQMMIFFSAILIATGRLACGKKWLRHRHLKSSGDFLRTRAQSCALQNICPIWGITTK